MLHQTFKKLVQYKIFTVKNSVLTSRLCKRNIQMAKPQEVLGSQEIVEGLAKIQTNGNVFYNPVQEFNRDLSITVISTFANKLQEEQEKKGNNLENAPQTQTFQPGIKYENGVFILEALSATGLRSIRYAKEIPGVRQIIANDISDKAVADINNNITLNEVEHLVTASHNDATMLMYQHRTPKDQFDIIDLDPYGCPSIFLDSAIQSVKNGGLLLITATDMAVLAGNSPETCHAKYGAISLRSKSCKEMALRILLQCIEAHANRYSRYIVPLMSLSADFYIRVFVRVYYGAQKCKYSTSKLSHVFHCTGCDSFELQPLGIIKANEKNNKIDKFCLPTGPPISNKCVHCGGSYHIGGPIWSAPIHSPEFIQEVLQFASPKLNTFKRIQGVLSVMLEELINVPLYYTLERLASTIKVETPPMATLRSAILNAGYKVSYTHMHKTSVKTNAPPKVVWDIMRCWEKLHPVSEKRKTENKVLATILAQKPEKEYSFEHHREADSQAKKLGLVRFQENPMPYWGPGSRSQAMIGGMDMAKSRKNQGKRKRDVEDSDDSSK